MPARSIAQRRFMGLCAHDPKHARGKCPDMTARQYHDFTTTPEKALPRRADKGVPGLAAAIRGT